VTCAGHGPPVPRFIAGGAFIRFMRASLLYKHNKAYIRVTRSKIILTIKAIWGMPQWGTDWGYLPQ